VTGGEGRQRLRRHQDGLRRDRLRVSDPCPPDRREDEHPAEDSTPRRLVRQQARDLSDREHEDQVEEELERGDLMLVAVLEFGLGHGWTLAQLVRTPLRRPSWSAVSIGGVAKPQCGSGYGLARPF
jgi:hypothetical protein